MLFSAVPAPLAQAVDPQAPIYSSTWQHVPEWDDYLDRWKANNDQWLKSTVATFTPDGPEIGFRPVDTSVLPPETPRDYR